MPTAPGYGTITTARYRPAFIHNATPCSRLSGYGRLSPTAQNAHQASLATVPLSVSNGINCPPSIQPLKPPEQRVTPPKRPLSIQYRPEPAELDLRYAS